MKSMAGKFSSNYTQLPGESKPDELRLLNQPLFRFETKDDAKSLDGAIFGFARGTAPLGLLLLEAFKSGDGYRWNYAFARMGTGKLTATYSEKEIFSVGKFDYRGDLKQTFLYLARQPVPKE